MATELFTTVMWNTGASKIWYKKKRKDNTQSLPGRGPLQDGSVWPVRRIFSSRYPPGSRSPYCTAGPRCLWSVYELKRLQNPTETDANKRVTEEKKETTINLIDARAYGYGSNFKPHSYCEKRFVISARPGLKANSGLLPRSVICRKLERRTQTNKNNVMNWTEQELLLIKRKYDNNTIRVKKHTLHRQRHE